MNTIAEALEQLRAGRPVLVADSQSRENEVDAVLSAELATPATVGWMVRHTSGYLCAPMTGERADHLGLPLMVPRSQDTLHTAYTLSVDAASGVTTGISGHDRSRTANVLADPAATPADLVRPGHMLPLRAVAGGVRERGGHTEASVELCALAGLAPVGVISELVHDDGSMMRMADAEPFAAEQGLVLVTIEALIAELDARGAAPFSSPRAVGEWNPDRVTRVAQAHLPTRHGDFTVVAYRDLRTGAEHLALSAGGVADAVDGPAQGASQQGVPLVRVHSECVTGDVFGSRKCDCGAQLDRALELIAEQGGVLVYLGGHEGRGIGLAEKIAAYALQEGGADTVEANVARGWDPDLREYGAAAAILRDLGVRQVRLLTNNPDKVQALAGQGIGVDQVVPLVVGVTAQNIDYLRTKVAKMGHLMDVESMLGVVGAGDDPVSERRAGQGPVSERRAS
ncbi:bifunctional 3,4-dihydroxy-2-butanone-4-phosphate synthase/GTP cyclohydrolase II [Propionibacterium freudenreichii]|uniref:bifunctional 3,4-dihydroxy-2-butanone-4-phosphate synthase/GTP cyclohydrolase II n=1 Tax=Propionibacterium freudenreichii TaxID=1744 RepID=UPI0005A5CB49|nr:bifunctional 3,4-dihydroxy-2-butanone-4-phosphate synthase/GTP cyclohydrolase II [Propionibacterium freudenreichii]MCT3000231.1 bifunctional 3,4-dihydroxy-2-butanone-4-phosphate synthase/GTP cyclohydrolase II [Propionibacterium freudenreichii]MDK9349408.1 bifunctional 3,4-dihydroxy-2-butanone-4-phosphate synthase/GTP cyclohydrolase II [Propionibacterium freudenreichii]MDK9626789.1 bifunctional 3,4-dihydroxy-2-butanone-4-phosphate synthase/GTP cyclohydrolase II [Propionibacterium freudenreichi